MNNPKITSKKILSLLSDQWLNDDDIVNELELYNPLDIKYLNLKLKELDRKEEIVSLYDDSFDQEFWRKNNFENWIEMAISFTTTLIDKDPFDAVIWVVLGDQYWEYFADVEIDVIKLYRIKNCYKTALRLVNTDINFNLYCNILHNLTYVYILLEKNDKTQLYLDIVLKAKEEIEEELLGRIYYLQARFYFSEEKYTKALDSALESQKRLLENSAVEKILIQIKSQDFSTKEQVELKKEQSTSQTTSSQKESEKSLQPYEYSMLKEMKKLTSSFDRRDLIFKRTSDRRDLILMKSYIHESVKPFLDKPSKKKLKKLEEMVNTYKDDWPDEFWQSFVKEYRRIIEQFKELQPSKWRKWGKILMKLITLI